MATNDTEFAKTNPSALPQKAQMSRFLTYLHERIAEAETCDGADRMFAPADAVAIEQFAEGVKRAQQGQAEREADLEYQAQLQADFDQIVQQMKTAKSYLPVAAPGGSE